MVVLLIIVITSLSQVISSIIEQHKFIAPNISNGIFISFYSFYDNYSFTKFNNERIIGINYSFNISFFFYKIELLYFCTIELSSLMDFICSLFVQFRVRFTTLSSKYP